MPKLTYIQKLCVVIRNIPTMRPHKYFAAACWSNTYWLDEANLYFMSSDKKKH